MEIEVNKIQLRVDLTADQMLAILARDEKSYDSQNHQTSLDEEDLWD